jgi:hypothetical protein
MWAAFTSFRIWITLGFCENGSEAEGFLMNEEFLDQFNRCHLKKNSIPLC